MGIANSFDGFSLSHEAQSAWGINTRIVYTRLQNLSAKRACLFIISRSIKWISKGIFECKRSFWLCEKWLMRRLWWWLPNCVIVTCDDRGLRPELDDYSLPATKLITHTDDWQLSCSIITCNKCDTEAISLDAPGPTTLLGLIKTGPSNHNQPNLRPVNLKTLSTVAAARIDCLRWQSNFMNSILFCKS